MFNVQCSIELLPALPENWKDGSVSGIRARGGIAVSMEWQDSKVSALTLTAQQPCKVILIANGKQREVKLKKGDNIIMTAFGAGFVHGANYLRWAYDGK